MDRWRYVFVKERNSARLSEIELMDCEDRIVPDHFQDGNELWGNRTASLVIGLKWWSYSHLGCARRGQSVPVRNRLLRTFSGMPESISSAAMPVDADHAPGKIALSPGTKRDVALVEGIHDRAGPIVLGCIGDASYRPTARPPSVADVAGRSSLAEASD